MPIPLRVLIVEDSEDDVLLFLRELRRGGYDVTHTRVETPETLRAALAEQMWDIVLSDYSMPAFTGLDALALLKENELDLPFILLSGTLGEERAVEALKAGAHDFIVKGKWARLIPAIQRELREAEVRRERKRAEETLRESEERFRSAIDYAAIGMALVAPDGRWLRVNRSLCDTVGYSERELLRMTFQDITHPDDLETDLGYVRQMLSGEIKTYQMEKRYIHKLGHVVWILLSVSLVHDIQGNPLYFISQIQDITDRKQAEEQIHRQFQQLQALRTIDNAISSSFDLKFTLNIVLEQVATQLNVDAADVLLLRPALQTLEYAAGRGFRSQAIARTRLRVGEGQAGRAALERRRIEIPNVAASGAQFAQPELLVGEDIAAYYAVPLIAKGEVNGVLEVYCRALLNPDAEWLAFLETLAGQTAIAIDNLALFQGLQRSNLELVLAYDTTIEGWSRALDLRDKETEGHTQRVTEMTLQLARAMGLSEQELVHVRRGALLHDIGKMGVPDSILLKPGKLTEEEWEVMRRHPQLAYEMLTPITYLKSALDIPYCHHEKWDGTGYPSGLKGEQIPLAARLFAVADVWDALTSDRPYRQAWSKEKAREYIREQAGKYFDPKMAKVFLRELANK